MSNRYNKMYRKAVKRQVTDLSREYLKTMLESPFLTRLRYGLIIIFKLGYRDLTGGNDGAERASTG